MKDTGQPLKVGLLDADVYGPSIPQLMNLHGRPETGKGELLPVCKGIYNAAVCNLRRSLFCYLLYVQHYINSLTIAETIARHLQTER